MSAKRIYLWAELPAELKPIAIARLNAMAEIRARDGQSVMPLGWAEAVAPALRYHVTPSHEIWTIEVTRALEAAGMHSIFDVPTCERTAA